MQSGGETRVECYRCERNNGDKNTFPTCQGIKRRTAGTARLLPAGNKLGRPWERGLEKKGGTGKTQTRQRELASEQGTVPQHPPQAPAAAASLLGKTRRGRRRCPPRGRGCRGRGAGTALPAGPPPPRRKRKRRPARRKYRCPTGGPGTAGAARQLLSRCAATGGGGGGGGERPPGPPPASVAAFGPGSRSAGSARPRKACPSPAGVRERGSRPQRPATRAAAAHLSRPPLPC